MNIFEGRESKRLRFKDRSELIDFFDKANVSSMSSTCILCGNAVSSLCDSHSVPKMVLKEIADSGSKVLLANSVFGISGFDVFKCTKRAGIFNIICCDCDGKVFQDYENPNNLKNTPTDKMMAEIALKNTLHQLRNRQIEIEFRNQLPAENKQLPIKRAKDEIKVFNDDIDLYKKLIKNDEHNRFTIVYYKRLPYKVPIAVETEVALPQDINGDPINIFSGANKTKRIQYIHLCVFPLGGESIVMLFYHNRDKMYSAFNNQFNELSEDKALSYLNWLIFKYTENYFFSKKVEEIITKNVNLQMLSQELNGFPSFGIGDPEAYKGFRRINPYEIPNLLDVKYSV